jgi:PAS domain S-box-containing protein
MTWTGFGIALLVGIALSFIAWNLAMRRNVAAQTRALSESEGRYALALTGTNDGIWERNYVTGEVHRTPRVFEILGFHPDELELNSRAFENLIHPNDLAHFADCMRSHLEERKSYNLEYRIRKKSGEYIWVRARGQAVWDEEGAPLRMAGSFSDISDYKREDLEWRNSAESFRDVLENAPYAIIVARSDGTMEFANRTAVELFRAETVDQFIGKNSRILLHPDHHEASTIRRGDILRGVIVPFLQRKRVRFDNTEFISESGASGCLWNGEPAVMMGIHDISDRVEAEGALQESEDRFRIVFENTGVGISMRNLQTGQRQFNHAFSQLFGYSADEMETMRLREIVHPDDLETGPGITDRIVAGELENVQKELRYIHKSGRNVWTLVNQGLVRDADRNAVALISAFQDITELKQAGFDLIKNEARFRSMADAASDWFWETDEKFNLAWLSFDHSETLGIMASELIGHPMWTQRGIELDDRQSWDEKVDTFLRNKKPFRNILVHPRIPKDGVHTISISGFPIFDDEGIFRGFRGACTDVTRQISAEEQLRQAQKMEAVGLLTGGIAHEFNNLLMVVVGNIEMLQARLPPEEAAERFAATALKGAMRGAELTQSLLTFSRKQTLATVAVDLNELIMSLHDMFQRTLGEKSVLVLELAENLPDILADKGQIEGALLNMILNARDAMIDGGPIIVRTSDYVLSADAASDVNAEPDDYVALEVIDTGHGMSAETIGQAFEPFFTTKDIGQGTGLGLSMVYGFAKQSGGYVEIESEIERGTTMRLCLKQARSDA